MISGRQFQGEVDEVFTFAEKSEYAPPEDVFRDVYADGLEVMS